MEMPDGFKRLAGLKKSLPYDTIIWTSVEDRENILSLMKEMAEALKQAEGLIESEWGPISEEEKSGLIDKGASKIFMALKKFKEWK